MTVRGPSAALTAPNFFQQATVATRRDNAALRPNARTLARGAAQDTGLKASKPGVGGLVLRSPAQGGARSATAGQRAATPPASRGNAGVRAHLSAGPPRAAPDPIRPSTPSSTKQAALQQAIELFEPGVWEHVDGAADLRRLRGGGRVWWVGEPVHRGAYGCVSYALDERDGTRCAVKEVRIAGLAPEAHGPKRYRPMPPKNISHEVHMARLLGHPSAQPIAALHSDDRVAIVMPFSGRLTDVISQVQAMLEDDRRVVGRSVVARLAEALADMHGRGFLFRDVKEQNILCDDTGDIFLCDFGCVRKQDRTGGATGLAGSYVYMAPELWERERGCAASDAWSLGVTMAALRAGIEKTPFFFNGGSAAEHEICARVNHDAFAQFAARVVPAGRLDGAALFADTTRFGKFFRDVFAADIPMCVLLLEGLLRPQDYDRLPLAQVAAHMRKLQPTGSGQEQRARTLIADCVTGHQADAQRFAKLASARHRDPDLQRRQP